jgi:phosphatidylserine decarboxylase
MTPEPRQDYDWPQPPGQTAIPIATTGYPLIAALAFVTVVFALLELTLPALLSLAGTLFVCLFFRDPERVAPTALGAVVSPADGRVIKSEVVEETDYLAGARLRISIFMNVFNVHVNRIPYEGTVTRIQYHPGKFFSANLDKASKENEHNAVFVRTGDGEEICFVQIAGLVARRIVCGLRQGDEVARGARFGMICFGSRLDVYLPADAKPAVAVGDRVRAGTSILAYMKGSDHVETV